MMMYVMIHHDDLRDSKKGGTSATPSPWRRRPQWGTTENRETLSESSSRRLTLFIHFSMSVLTDVGSILLLSCFVQASLIKLSHRVSKPPKRTFRPPQCGPVDGAHWGPMGGQWGAHGEPMGPPEPFSTHRGPQGGPHEPPLGPQAIPWGSYVWGPLRLLQGSHGDPVGEVPQGPARDF